MYLELFLSNPTRRLGVQLAVLKKCMICSDKVRLFHKYKCHNLLIKWCYIKNVYHLLIIGSRLLKCQYKHFLSYIVSCNNFSRKASTENSLINISCTSVC